MEGLLEFYGKKGDAFDEVTDFIDSVDDICYTTVKLSAPGAEVAVEHCRTTNKQEVTQAIAQAGTPNNRLLSCLITAPHSKSPYPGRIGIAEKNFKYFLDTFGLTDYAKFACSNPLSFDVVPWYENGRPKGFHASSYAKRFYGLYLVYDKDRDFTLGIFWGGPQIDHVLIAALADLRSLAEHPYHLLLVLAASLNAFNQQHLESIRVDTARVEERTGYKGWGNSHFRPMEGSFSDLSAQMSGFISSLVTHRRSVRLTLEILETIETVSLVEKDTSDEKAVALWHLLGMHVAVIRRRANVQAMFVDLLLGRVHNQVTAVSPPPSPSRNPRTKLSSCSTS